MNTKKILSLTLCTLLLSSCGMMPGMKNPDMAEMQRQPVQPQVRIVPTLIPITPERLTDRHTNRYVYRVAPSDVLSITVWEHPELSDGQTGGQQVQTLMPRSAGEQGILVNSVGDIYFPLTGRTHVAGRTVDEVRSILTKKLKKYIKHPELNVRVRDFRGRKVYVFGEVKKPGLIALNDQPLSITESIVLAGGFDPTAADPSRIYVIHGRIERPEIYWLNAGTPDALLLAEHFYLNPGDIVFVSSAPAARWNRVIAQLLPTVQTVWYTNAILHSNY